MTDSGDEPIETVTEAELEQQAEELRRASAVFGNIRESVG